jgi:hypothetical protein
MSLDNTSSYVWRTFSSQSQIILAETYFEVQYWWYEDDSGGDDWILWPNVADDIYPDSTFATMEGQHSKSALQGDNNAIAWYTVKLLPLTGQ